MQRFLSLFAILLFCVGSPLNLAFAVDYYVSGTGDDANDGLTSATAFRTISHAMTLVATGDRIIVGAGTYDQASGETFPIDVADGVSIEGPGSSLAVVDSTSVGGITFSVGPLIDATTINGLTIQASMANGIGVVCTDLPTDLTINGNEISGRDGIHNLPGGSVQLGGSTTLVVSNNTVSTTRLGVAWGVQSVTAAHQITVANNTIQGAATPLLLSALQTVGTGSADLSAIVSGNTITPATTGDVAVALNCSASGSNAATLDAVVAQNLLDQAARGIGLTANAAGSAMTTVSGSFQGNTIVDCGDGVGVTVIADDSATVMEQVAVQANTITNSPDDGISLAGVARDSGHVVAACTVDCNSVTGSGGDGQFLQWIADNAAMLTANVSVTNNFLAGNERGVLGDFYSRGIGATFGGNFAFTANTITGNNSDGVRLQSETSGFPVVNFTVDFGGLTPGILGRNTISGNGGFDFNVAGKQSAVTIPATGNWWGVNSATGIETLVNDQDDNPAFATVDYQPFLMDPLVFTVGSLGAGDVGVASAELGSAFVQKAGTELIAVLFDAVPAAGPVVAANGASVSFTVPGGLAPGSYVLTITSAGGQTGTLVVNVAEGGDDNGGSCFVATAAYGDSGSPEVATLRRWRDDCLADNALGRQFVRAYYSLSPGIAEAISKKPLARTAVRAMLFPVVGAAKLWMERPWIFGLAGAVLIWRLLRKRR